MLVNTQFVRLGMIIVGALVSFGSIAHAQGLDGLLPGFGEIACYGRSYDPAHLSRHPDQLVTSMVVSLQHWREPMGDGSKGFQATVGVTVRGQSKRHVTSTLCRRYPGSQILKCTLECDMGVFDLVASSRQGSLTLELSRIVFDEACDGEGYNTFELSAGRDDRTFRLDPADTTSCRDLENQFERSAR